jgi:hypothetical protein
MATQNPLLSPGTWVQLNPNAVAGYIGGASKFLPLASIPEQTVGRVRQAFNGMNGPYYLIVWQPGNRTPKVGLYQGAQLCAITQQKVNEIQQQITQGQYTVQTGTQQNEKGVSI